MSLLYYSSAVIYIIVSLYRNVLLTRNQVHFNLLLLLQPPFNSSHHHHHHKDFLIFLCVCTIFPFVFERAKDILAGLYYILAHIYIHRRCLFRVVQEDEIFNSLLIICNTPLRWIPCGKSKREREREERIHSSLIENYSTTSISNSFRRRLLVEFLFLTGINFFLYIINLYFFCAWKNLFEFIEKGNFFFFFKFWYIFIDNFIVRHVKNILFAVEK